MNKREFLKHLLAVPVAVLVARHLPELPEVIKQAPPPPISSPSISFTNDADTGMYHSSKDQLHFVVGGMS